MLLRKFILGWFICLCLGVGYVAQAQTQPDPIKLVKQYSESLLEIGESQLRQSAFYKRLINYPLWVVGSSENTIQAANELASVLPADVKKVQSGGTLNRLSQVITLEAIAEEADFASTIALLNKQKLRLSSIWNEQGRKRMALFTSLTQAQEGIASEGYLTLGNYLEVQGKAEGQKVANIALIPTHRAGLEGLQAMFSNSSLGSAWIVRTRPLRNHLLVRHFQGDFALFRALLLRFDYIIFIHQAQPSQ